VGNQEDVDYVNISPIRGYVKNGPTEKSNKNYGPSNKITLRKNI
jgi:hypothetical protein